MSIYVRIPFGDRSFLSHQRPTRCGIKGSTAWSVELQPQLDYTFPPIVGNDAVFLATGDSYLRRFEATQTFGAVLTTQDASWELGLSTSPHQPFPGQYHLILPLPNGSVMALGPTPPSVQISDISPNPVTFPMNVQVEGYAVPGSNPVVAHEWIVDGTTLTFGYDAAHSNTVTTRNASDGLRGGIQYARDIRALDFDVVPGFIEGALRALAPARVEESDFFRSLVGARLRWTPQRIGFGSNYAKRESEAYRYTTIVEDTSDLSVRPIESPRRGLENNAEINFQPFQAISAGLAVRSVRDLLDPPLRGGGE